MILRWYPTHLRAYDGNQRVSVQKLKLKPPRGHNANWSSDVASKVLLIFKRSAYKCVTSISMADAISSATILR